LAGRGSRRGCLCGVRWEGAVTGAEGARELEDRHHVGGERGVAAHVVVARAGYFGRVLLDAADERHAEEGEDEAGHGATTLHASWLRPGHRSAAGGPRRTARNWPASPPTRMMALIP